MNTVQIVFGVVWLIVMMVAIMLALAILERRGRRGRFWAALAILGAGGSFPMLNWYGGSRYLVLAGFISFLFFGLSAIGLTRPRQRDDRCAECGYDLSGETDSSSARCPECGAARPLMRNRCLECKGDVAQAVAGGSIVCPHCGADIARRRR